MAKTYELVDGKLMEVTTQDPITEGPWTLEQIDLAIADHQAEVDKWTARREEAVELGAELEADVPQTPLPVDEEPEPF